MSRELNRKFTNKFKVGDKVRVCENFPPEEERLDCGFVDNMKETCGEIYKVTKIGRNYYYLQNSCYYYEIHLDFAKEEIPIVPVIQVMDFGYL